MRLIEALQFDVNSDHDGTIEQCRVGMPSTACLLRAQTVQQELLARRIPLLRCMTRQIYDLSRNVSDSERRALNSLLHLPQLQEQQQDPQRQYGGW